MSTLPRLNAVIGALEKGLPAFTTFSPPNIAAAIATSTSPYDGVVFEMEHNPWNPETLRDCLQYMLSRGQIAAAGSLAPAVTPMVRIPPNGSELAQWQAKQALDLGVYGVVWPHVSTAEEAYNAVAACRYPRQPEASLYEPRGLRGDGPTGALRYWGLSQQDYYKKADVWPLNPEGEIIVIVMIEDSTGIGNLPEILKTVPGIGAILIGEGDLSQELGYPRQYDHPVVAGAMAEIVNICKSHDVPVGHPHVNEGNVEQVLEQGYRFLMVGAERTTKGLMKGLKLTGRS
ncbi:MAG: 4-hydroxy-2-oxoheptanedioate aldolase [Alphaproteobacteria bacterium]|jgi:4-hydroxy-2-oxoheptanedioate aldolase